MAKTIHGAAEQLHSALCQYIEAAYHISDAKLIAQRKSLLQTPQVIHQEPFIESTPRYKAGQGFSDIQGLDPAVLEAFEVLAQPDPAGRRLIYDPPYTHQADAVRSVLVEQRSAVIMTGTGSGKTESFFLPIVGKLAQEAKGSPAGFRAQNGMRALVLYPMNALVNDQLGRLRSFFAHDGLVELFKRWAGRPPRFARYTSRTPYAGVRTAKRDQRKLTQFRHFFVQLVEDAEGDDGEKRVRARALMFELRRRGKWPAKPDMRTWYGKEGARWQDKDSNRFLRAVTLPADSELLTRDEVQSTVPDLLVTNYSMLEYMMMRPIERGIFDSTRDWLKANPSQSFLLILDEAHLYRGAAGAEVGLLLRRLRDRLEIEENRFQVVCSTASFENKVYAPQFASQLTGVPEANFSVITGEQDLRDHDAHGSLKDAEVLAGIDIDALYSLEESKRRDAVTPLLSYLGKKGTSSIERDLYEALIDYPPLAKLVNDTMGYARPIKELGPGLFPEVKHEIADRATSNLASLASVARRLPHEPNLLPCRIHTFFRGLRGLWICMDPVCSSLPEGSRSGLCGKMFSQPRETCECGSRVLEFFTCRYCGSAYARGYCEDIARPTTIWPDPGSPWRTEYGEASPLQPIDLLLEEPRQAEFGEPADYDLELGLINPPLLGRSRRVTLPPSLLPEKSDTDDEDERLNAKRGRFQPCGVCRHSQANSTVQDHETKGDQPFQVLVAKQIHIQQPGPMDATDFAPLRGRKVLAFSDSRQVAARLAPNLQMYSSRDSMRPLMARGFQRLQMIADLQPCLDDLYFSVLLAAGELGVRLRPELGESETATTIQRVAQFVATGGIQLDEKLRALSFEIAARFNPIESLLGDIAITLQDRSMGLEALAIASIIERADRSDQIAGLPDIPAVATTVEQKQSLARAWIRCWHAKRIWFRGMPARWYQGDVDGKLRVTSATGKFTAINRLLGSASARKVFETKWRQKLLDLLTEPMGAGKYRLLASGLTLSFDGAWVRCNDCKSVHRPVPGLNTCLDCARPSVHPLEPASDSVFLARKGFYRDQVTRVLGPAPEPPHAIIAAEHTAQLNSARNDDVFSKAERNELLFQDVRLEIDGEKHSPSAIDVLSSTTTMEVGIDIGQLSGVALRNMPPGRANYQQRAGRAGRRGTYVATVVAFGGSDTHDEYYFCEPKDMIRGPVVDPILSLSNAQIVKRHVCAYLLQRYHQDRVRKFDASQPQDLFSVLGSAVDFKHGKGTLNRLDFEQWLNTNADTLKARVAQWIPRELDEGDRQTVLDGLVTDCLGALEVAMLEIPAPAKSPRQEDEEDDGEELPPEQGEERPRAKATNTKLLDWLLYKGVLPRYAFPTDVATFHVFDRERSSKYYPALQFAPNQGLAVALSQYAPGRDVWISGKCYRSGALYSPFDRGGGASWGARKLYLECSRCGFAVVEPRDASELPTGLSRCRACNSPQSLGPARFWLRPVGFAHPVDFPVVTSPDDMPETSYATRAKLTMETPSATERWNLVSDNIRALGERAFLLVSNSGPSREGYAYCTLCGRIEASTLTEKTVVGPHPKPYPDQDEPDCPGGRTSPHVVLGTDFVTDVALFSLRVNEPVVLRPTDSTTQLVLRTVSEALARAATQILQIEPGEVMAEFRPALTPGGVLGREAEVFLYDTLPGGAGFSLKVAARARELFERAHRLLAQCPENCDSSCYRCLRTFRNKIDHAILDRFAGAALVEYLLAGNIPDANPDRTHRYTSTLFAALTRQSIPGVSFERDVAFKSPKGHQRRLPILAVSNQKHRFAIGLSKPLAANLAADADLNVLEDNEIKVVVVDELLVRKNLPAACQVVRAQLTL